MIRWLLLRSYVLAEPWVRHPNWMVRRIAQVGALGVAIVWLALPGASTGEGSVRSDDIADQMLSSPRLREFLNGNAIGKPVVGRICRVLVLRLSVYAKTRKRAASDDRNFALRLKGPIDQRALRNLLIWQNHVLPSHMRAEDCSQVDIVLVLANGSQREARLFDLFSTVLMLERLRSFSVFWDEDTAGGTASIIMSERELSRWQAAEATSDLGNMPPDITRQVELHGTRGGVKLLQHGRKYANDFLKLTLPGRFIVAVGLREREDGTVEPEELEVWLGLLDKLHARDSRAAFVVLNCIAPSQWREWPAYLRFARHQGLTLQDTICLAQIADGYVGVLDMLGLTAHSAGRPGVYIPLEDGEPSRLQAAAADAQTAQVMVGSRRRSDIETALESFAPVASIRRADLA
jgi:hypothetical protein